MARSVVSRSPTKQVEAVSRPAKAPRRRAEPDTPKSQPKSVTPEAGPARTPPKQRSGDAPKTVRAKPKPREAAAEGKTPKKPARSVKKTSADNTRGVAAARRENARAARAAWSETHKNTSAPEEETSSRATGPGAGDERTQGGGAGSGGHQESLFLTPEVEAFATNMARLWEESGRAVSAYMRPRESGAKGSAGANEVMDVVKTLGQVAERWLADPGRVAEAQRAFTGGFLDLWAGTLRRFSGEAAEPVVQPDPKDQRFRDPEWSEHPAFDFLKQAYLHASRWAERMVDEAEELDPHTRQKAAFYVKLLSNAVSPSNFVPTNPELIRETLASKGENLVRGMRMLAEDIAAGEGDLRIRQTDPTSFEVGRNLALSPGKVVYRGELFELIQYSPATEMVRTRPIVIVPPWINKFYILDLTPEKSMIKWCVEQGLTIFCVSWVNPDRRHAQKSFEHYMREGIMRAVDVAREICGVEKVDTVGYCVGGTLLAITLAYMAATGDERIASATFMTAQVDFTDAGDLKVFVDEDQIAAVEAHMAQTGYLEGARMANAFNMIRSNDLIWPYVVNNYLKGKAPFPFDLLYWNSDATRMPAANHSFYLRGCYLNNDLAEGRMEIGGTKLDLKKVTVPTYNLATREDHIAPARSVFLGAQLFGGPARFVLSGSGHIAGVVNPPARMKYQHWVGEEPRGRLSDWFAQAEERPGSWWPDWRAWLAALDATMVPARTPGDGPYPAIEDAPGSYVKVRA